MNESNNNPTPYRESSGPVIARLKRWGAMRYPWPLWLIPIALISPAAFLIPVDVFVQYPWVETYTRSLAKVIPMIDRAAHLYPHPQQFKAFFAYAWSWLPLCLFLAWFEHRKFSARIERDVKVPALFFVMLLFAIAIGLLWYAPDSLLFGSDLMSRSDSRSVIYESRFSWLWSGALQVYLVAFLQVSVFTYLRSVWANRPQHAIGPK